MNSATTTNGTASNSTTSSAVKAAGKHTLETLRDATFGELNVLVTAGEITSELAGQVMANQHKAAAELGAAQALAANGGTSGGKGKGKKTVCPVSLDEFRAGSKPIELRCNGQTLVAEVKEFSTGSFGWFYGGKVSVKIGEETVTVQVGLNMTVVGSKELAKG